MPKTPRRPRRRPLNQSPEAVRWARSRTGYRQIDLARAVGISRSYMSEIESGERSAPPDVLARIAEQLNCPISMLERPRGDENAA